MDRLAGVLAHFELHARVFQAGPLCHSARFDATDGLGYIHVLKAGRLKVETAGQTPQILREPCLFFYMQPVSHRLLPARTGVDILCASFDFGARVHNPLTRALPDLLLLPLDKLPSLATTLELLFTEAQQTHCGRQVILDRLIEVIIVQLLRDLMDENRLQTGLLAGLADARLAKAIDAIHTEPARAWTLATLAQCAGISRARFAAHFHATVGMTPGYYLASWRIGIAQSLLRSGKSMQFIADAVGYANASALSRAFIAHVGLSPRAWYKQHNQS